MPTEPADGTGAGAPAGRLPAGWIAVVVATIVSALCVLIGYSESQTGGCEGGLCGIPVLLGVVAAIAGWPIVFGVVWGLVRLANRRG